MMEEPEYISVESESIIESESILAPELYTVPEPQNNTSVPKIESSFRGFVSDENINKILEEAQQISRNTDDISPHDAWKVVDAYTDEYGLVRGQIESYNNFVDRIIPQLIDSLPIIEGKCENLNSAHRYETHTIKFSNPRLTRPHLIEQSRKKITIDEKTKSVIKDTSSITLTRPKTARDRKLTYSGRLYVECTHTITKKIPGEEEKSITRHNPTLGFGYIPIIVKSDYCALNGLDEQSLYEMGEDPSDPGGYFITNGGEKVLIAQERMRYNHVFVFKKTSTSNKAIYEAEVRSIREMSYRPASLVAMRFKTISKKGGLPTVRIIGFPYLRQGQEIPLSILFKALGITSDEEMCFRIVHNMNDAELLSLLRGTIREGNREVKTQEEALNYIGMRTTNTEKDKALRIQYVRDLLTRELFPHVGDDHDVKAHFLGMMAKELIMVSMGRKEQSDRDHYGQKRVSAAGQLMGELLAQIFQKLIKDSRNTLNKYLNEGRPFDVSLLVKEKAVTQGLKYAISTGNWSANKIAGNKSGVSAVLMRLSFISTLSHLRRINTPIGKDGKLSKPRHLSGTHWGMVNRHVIKLYHH